MTLLESLIALVVLGLSAVGFLDLFQEVSARTAATASRAQVVAVAEATMEHALAEPSGAVPTYPDSAGLRRRVELRAHATGLRELVVTVERDGGGRVSLHRLVGP